MTTVKYTTNDGFILEVFASGYMDWGLRIYRPDKRKILDNPHYLDHHSWGYDDGEEWSEEEWKERLALEADDLISAWDEEEDYD